jgi:hypothetical protein
LFARLGLRFEEIEPEGRDAPGACHKTISDERGVSSRADM